jgi:hypothetical protein
MLPAKFKRRGEGEKRKVNKTPLLLFSSSP